ncbi:DUF4148 domain-containing protein [Caballeronia sp. LZ062]|uniref:DUF4148 domain-containing protein n=1 Tax=unclassified Caballeronia TaxID=2646786 RepID=UPI0028541BC8|nr:MULTISPECIES: DUF4148 domain-containing protein [unclassified Caballeronia]MDR5857698.1 DUF4148 domain-containing protein [Caballeronia sp. LZ050]MDR5869248.1 DUF4148 domain-containing protein [Caballeronia sp. LZ062]
MAQVETLRENHGIRRRMTAGVAAVCSLALALVLAPEVHADSPSNAAHSAKSKREQVREDLARYRCAGYNPVADEITYPNDVDAARERLQDAGCTAPDAPTHAEKHSK